MNDTRIHRSTLNGGTVCNAGGRVRLSASGVGVTCHECIELVRPVPRDVALAESRLREACRRLADAGTALNQPPATSLPARAYEGRAGA